MDLMQLKFQNSFEYFSNGGTINIEKGTQDNKGKPTTSIEELYVDEY